jgi:uncharacterized protein (TIGR02594 family)
MHEDVPWLDYLVRHIGAKEIPGPKYNPLIVQWGKDAGIDWWNNDDDAWCAVAVNGALVNCGFPSTRSALARSFTRYGTKLAKPVRGAIVVFPRGSNPIYGHVGLVESLHENGTMTVVNGNVGNEVRRSTFRIASVLPDGIRWPPGADAPAEAKPTLRETPLGARILKVGARGSDVAALQRDLVLLGYDVMPDGDFGPKTQAAVQAFEARRGLKADGVADAAMLAALTAAAADRRARHGRTAAAAKAAAPIAGAGAVATVGAVVSAGVQMAKEIRSLDDGTLFGAVLAAAVLAAVGGSLLWRFAIRRAAGPAAEDTL